MERCIGCGALANIVEGGTHRYLGTSVSCWAVYTEVLAWVYSDERYQLPNHYLVDCYALQHPGTPNPQTIQSSIVHLISLYGQLELGYNVEQATQIKRIPASLKAKFYWLEPPPAQYLLTIHDLAKAMDPLHFKKLADEWAHLVWDTWHPHHQQIKKWIEDLL